MVSYKALNTAIESSVSNCCLCGRKIKLFQAAAVFKGAFTYGELVAIALHREAFKFAAAFKGSTVNCAYYIVDGNAF